MKKTVYLFSIAILAFSSIIKSQSVAWGTEIDEKSPYQFNDITGHDSKGFFVKKIELNRPHTINATFPPNCSIQKYDYTGKQLFSLELNVMDNTETTKPMYYDGILYMKDNFVTIMYDRGVKTAYLIKVGFNGTIDSKKNLVGDVENTWKVDILAPNRYRFSVSNDSTKLMAFYHKDYASKIEMKFFDENLTELNEKTVDFGYTGKDADRETCYYNGDQAIFLVHIKHAKSSEPDYFVYIYDIASGSYKKIALDVHSRDDDWSSKYSLRVRMSAQGDVVLSALYGDEQSKENPVGIYYARVNHGATALTVNKSIRFSSDFISYFSKDPSKGIDGLTFKGFAFAPDGGIVFGAEHYKSGTYAGDHSAVIGNIATDGKMAWIKKITKKQYVSSIYDKYSSYSFAVANNKIYLVYNDDPENAKVNPEQAAKNEDLIKRATVDKVKNNGVTLVTLNLSDGGGIKLSSISQQSEGELIFTPVYTELINPNALILVRTWSNNGDRQKYQFGYLGLN
ncbi:MAG TPA: hypothetical protein VK809_10220 [Bacteroidia bacterium]|nr:hypothetical protein [Bacteroidia bacterium]